ITARSSMRLLVVSASPPCSFFSWAPWRSSAPQPPGPGLPLQAPSVHICTTGSAIAVVVLDLVRHRRHRRAAYPAALALAPCRADQASAGDALDRRDRIDGAARGPPAVPRMLHEAP